ncbi:MAG: hypothetical protein JWN62_2088 [Acidimicrobiales bacterium]|nr:hypothetical protein [Acidimicrobiales bacterium]
MSKLARGVAALVALVVLSAGIPAALVRYVGRPWPTRMPALDLVVRSIRQGDISDAVVIKFLAVLVWLAWARLMISVIVEIGSRCSGRRVPRISGLGSAQHWAAALVAAITLLTASSKLTLAASSAALPRPIPAALLQVGPMSWGAMDDLAGGSVERPVEWSRTASVSASVPASGVVHVVLRHESFWSIAEDALGDGARWREIVDINSGREVAPGIVFDGTPERLQPGWQLLVPGDSIALPDTATVAGAVATHEVTVQAGDTLSGIAAAQLGDATAWPTIWDLNREHAFDGRTFDDPNLILPGWTLALPDPFADVEAPVEAPSPVAPANLPDAAAVPETTAVSDETVAPGTTAVTQATVAPETTVVPATDVADPAATPDSAPALVIPRFEDHATPPLGGLGAAVLVAGGVLSAAAVRRRRRLRSASVHARLVRPSADMVEVERVLRDLDRGERIARLDVALRAAAHDLGSAGPSVRVLGVIAAADGQLDLLLSGATAEAPAPWQQVSGHRWRLPARIELTDLAEAARHSQHPCPALAHLGATRLDDGVSAELFIDLEAVGVLAVDAPPAVADSIVRAIAAGVAVSPMAEVADLVTAGLDDPLLGHPSTRRLDSLANALLHAEHATGATAAVAGDVSTFHLRARQQAGEAWEPTIVFVGSGAAPAEGKADVRLAERVEQGGKGVAVVVAAGVEAAQWVLRPLADGWRLDPLGLDLVPVGISASELMQLQQVLDDADVAPVLSAVAPVDDVGESAAPASMVGRGGQPSWTLMVHVLGKPQVTDTTGGRASFERSKALELVVWLSQHRERATRSGARTALWESNVRDATFANVVSDARRSLGRLVGPPPDEEWIGRTLTDELPLHVGVVTDAEVLAASLRAARNASPDEAIELLRPALTAVRDMPFAGSAYLWPDTEGITSELILLVTSAASVLSEHLLDLGDTEGVFWATGQGLKVLPGHEELIALRMRAHARDGDLAGVRHVWDSYLRVLSSDTWSDGEPAEKLVTLRRELLAPSMSMAASA